MSFYPSTQGISRAELEEEFHDEVVVGLGVPIVPARQLPPPTQQQRQPSIQQRQQPQRRQQRQQYYQEEKQQEQQDDYHWDPISGYNDPISDYPSAVGHDDSEAGDEVSSLSYTRSFSSSKYHKGDKSSRASGGGRSIRGWRSSRGGESTRGTVPIAVAEEVTPSLAPSHYVEGDAVERGSSSWDNSNHERLLGGGDGNHSNSTGAVPSSSDTPKNDSRVYARAGGTGRGFACWPVLCCLIIGGPLMVLLSAKEDDDRATPTMMPTFVPTMTPTIAPTTASPTKSPTASPTVTPTTAPTENSEIRIPTFTPATNTAATNATWPVEVDLMAESGLYLVHDAAPVSFSVLVPHEASLLVNAGEYLTIDDACSEFNGTKSSGEDIGSLSNETTIPDSDDGIIILKIYNDTKNVTAIEYQVDLTEAKDTTMALCVNGTVTAAMYHLFPDNVEGQNAEVRCSRSRCRLSFSSFPPHTFSW